MLATLPDDKIEVWDPHTNDSCPMIWRYGYIFACDNWFYATCSTLKSNRVVGIIITSNEELLLLIQDPQCKINNIYLMTPRAIDGKVLLMQKIKSVYRSGIESSHDITIELENGNLLVLSKDGPSEQKDRVFFSEDQACDQNDPDTLAPEGS